MSDKTYSNLEDALRAHIADLSDGAAMLTDWRVTAASVDPNYPMGSTGYIHITSEHTPAHSRLGLALVGYREEKADWDSQMEGDGE